MAALTRYLVPQVREDLAKKMVFVPGPRQVHALILGLILTLAGMANNMMIPPPAWFWVVSLLVFVPFAYFGARLARRRTLPAASA